MDWKLDSGGKQISLALWQLLDDQDGVQQTIAYLDTNGKIKTLEGVESLEFGNVTINVFDPVVHKKLKVTVEFVGADQIFDRLIFQSVGE